MSNVRFNPVPPTIRFAETSPRATEATGARRFREGLANAASAVLSGVEAASSLIPGASIVTAALRSDGAATPGNVAGNVGTATQGLTSSGQAAEAPTVTGGDAGLASLGSSTADQNMQFLRMQEQLQAENRRYSALSNALKARHETAKNSINNIR